MRRPSRFFILLLVVSGSVHSKPPAEPAERLAGVLSGIDSLYARYEQQSSAPGAQAGEFWLKKPGHFRVDSGPPLSQTVVSNSSTLWTYDLDLEQVIISDVQSGSVEIPLLLFAGDPAEIAARYDIEFFEDEVRQHFVLRPHDNSSLVQALALSFEDDVPASILVETSMQERTTITLHDQAALTEADDARFDFQPPAYVDVIDDRAPADPASVDAASTGRTPASNVTLP